MFEVIFKEETKNIKVYASAGGGIHADIKAGVMAEIVDFLREQHAIEGGVVVSQGSVMKGSLPIPVIESKDGDSEIPKIEVEPFTSLQVESAPVKTPVKVPEVETSEGVKTSVDSDTPKGPVIVGGSLQDESELKKRPVIRTRVTDDSDPLGAEKAASAIRGIGNEKSSIKRL